MRKLVLTVLTLGFISLNAGTAQASDYHFLQQKREEAAKQRMQLLQQIQHKQANPTAFLANVGKEDKTPASVSFEPSANGHYYIPVAINGRSVDFIADTGATSIFLTQNDAKRIGLNVDNLNYNKIYNTANGQIKAATTIVKALKVGPIELTNVDVSVSPVPGGQSLLGMAFFRKLSSYDVKNNTLTLYK